jgi:hypothetical protein
LLQEKDTPILVQEPSLDAPRSADRFFEKLYSPLQQPLVSRLNIVCAQHQDRRPLRPAYHGLLVVPLSLLQDNPDRRSGGGDLDPASVGAISGVLELLQSQLVGVEVERRVLVVNEDTGEWHVADHYRSSFHPRTCPKPTGGASRGHL